MGSCADDHCLVSQSTSLVITPRLAPSYLVEITDYRGWSAAVRKMPLDGAEAEDWSGARPCCHSLLTRPRPEARTATAVGVRRADGTFEYWAPFGIINLNNQ